MSGPLGHKEFVSLLYDLNVPKHLIGIIPARRDLMREYQSTTSTPVTNVKRSLKNIQQGSGTTKKPRSGYLAR